jgi:hypothetical protein
MTANDEQYLKVIKTLDPQLYMIKIALDETGVNPDILPRIIRVLGNLNLGTGYGVIEIMVRSKTVTQIKSGESDILNMSIDSEQQKNYD